MSFFIRKKSGKAVPEKRKKTLKNVKASKKSKNSEKKNGMQEIISSDEELSGKEDFAETFGSDEETAEEKRLRLAQKYLKQIENEERGKNSVDDTKKAVAQRLKDEALDEIGQLQKKKAHEYENVIPEIHHEYKSKIKDSVTCVVMSSSEKFIYTGSKDCSIVKWSIEEKQKVHTINGYKKDEKGPWHTGPVLTLALSSDDKFLASGCERKIIHIWNPDTMQLLKTFTSHKNKITGLVFQRATHQLISASQDMSLKLWNLDEMGYVETMLGHEDGISDIDSFPGGTVVTSGSRDNSVRIWKIAEESQLMFQAHGCSLDCICVSSHQSFVSGGDDGSLLFWGVKKKKPISKVLLAHGCEAETDNPNWIISLCALQNTDLIASGSNDGFIRLWRRDDESRTLVPISSIPVKGHVNSLQFSPSGNYLVAAIGQTHKFGRWAKVKDSKNCAIVFSWLNKKNE